MASVGSQGGASISLDLKPMLDVFSVLITFLLMTFSADPVSHDVRAAIELPQSKTIRALDEIPTITVTRSELFVNDKKITSIIGGDVPEKDRTQGAIYPLFQELEKLAQANERIAKLATKDVSPSTLTMEMDKDHKFKLMKRIMLSAQQAEFVTFKLEVAKQGN